MTQNLQQIKEAFLMAKHMFILLAHSWNLSDAYKKVYAVFVIKTVSMQKKFLLRKEILLVRLFYMLSFSHKQIPFPNQESFYSKWANIYLYRTLFDSQTISVSHRFLLLWQENFYSKQVNSCLFWAFFFS